VSFRVTLNGVSATQKKLQNYQVATSAEVQQALVTGALAVAATAKRSIQNSPPDPDTGRSKPGNPPKTDTGRLVNSITVDTETTREGVEALVGTNVAYGRHLEFGTRTIAARPWLGPALRQNIKKIRESVALAVVEARKRVLGG
jgi:HK97 gp10 family phage protein